jgi:RNAse R (EC 3.1.-.-)
VIEDIISVHAGTRLFSHRLIEEFMIAANERVAEYLGARQRIFPYRIHPQPDEKKLETLLRMLSHTSLVDRLPRELNQMGLQQVSQAAKGTDIEYLVNRLILRTMMQAQYSPDNDGIMDWPRPPIAISPRPSAAMRICWYTAASKGCSRKSRRKWTQTRCRVSAKD